MSKEASEKSTRKPVPNVNLYLVGFMATGKSTAGRSLAHRLGMRFLDSDQEIERHTGRPVRKIFESEGEEAFRRYEREFIERGHPANGCVVACGGGLVTSPGMIDLLRAKGVVVCLYATVETILNRVRGNRNRPLLNVADPEKKIAELLAKREPFYKAAGTLVLTDSRSMGEVTDHLRRVYLREAAAFHKRAGSAGA